MALASFLRLEEHLFRKISTMYFNLEYDDCIPNLVRTTKPCQTMGCRQLSGVVEITCKSDLAEKKGLGCCRTGRVEWSLEDLRT